MIDDSETNKIATLEKRVTILEEKNNDTIDENSVIALVLDVFNFKRFLELIFLSQKRVVFTHYFVNLVLLFLFLAFVFWQSEIPLFNKSPAMIILAVIAIAGIVEVIGANTSLFKRFFVKNAKTKQFFDKLPTMSLFEVERFLSNQSFSSACLNYFIKGLEDKNKYCPEIVYLVFDKQAVTGENLDLLLHPKIIKNLQPDLIIRVLYKCENYLRFDHIKSIYDNFNHHDDVVKILFATQKYSNCLFDIDCNDTIFKKYYKEFQIEKKHMNWFLKLYPVNYIPFTVGLIIVVGFFLFALIVEQAASYIPSEFEITLFGAMGGFLIYLINPLGRYLHKIYRVRYIKSVTQL